MVEIIFQSKEDAKKLFHSLHLQLQASKITNKNIILLSEDGHIGKIQIANESFKSMGIVKKAFFHFILDIKQDDWFRIILKDHYYYEDEDEQQQIIDIIHSILEGSRVELCAFMDDRNQSQYLLEVIDQIFQEDISFSFDSFVRFRLRPFMDQLEKYVELSIDEYKMEQEYQMFVQTLREFLLNRESKLDHLHLVIDDGHVFYDEQFYEIKRAELLRMIDRKLLSNHPVYVDSVTIAPLLSISPYKIYLYTDDREQPLVRTIRNIFEERVVLNPVSAFYERKSLFSFSAEKKV